MGNLEAGLVHKLKNTAAVSALVGTRIYPLRLPQTVTFPAVVYQRVSTVYIHTHGAAGVMPQARMQITCWADTIEGARALGVVVRQALDGVHGVTWGSGSGKTAEIEFSLVMGERMTDLSDETKLAYVQLDFQIMYK